MSWFDGVILGFLTISALLAFMRGFVRLTLSVAAWVGAAYIAFWYRPLLVPQVRFWVDEVGIADLVALATAFVVALIAFTVLSGWISGRVREFAAGPLDRTLGLVFGLARGAALLTATYIFAQQVVPADRWPSVVLRARSLALAYSGANWVVTRLPERFRPQLEPPPTEPLARAADLLRANPLGYALPGRDAPVHARDYWREQGTR